MRWRVFSIAFGSIMACLGLLLPEGQRVLIPVFSITFLFGLVGWRGMAAGFTSTRTPVLIFICLFSVAPGVLSLLLSVFDVHSANFLHGGWRYIGLTGFQHLLSSADERDIFLRTAGFAAACVLLQFTLGVPWGYLISGKQRLDWADSLLVLPVVIPPIISAMLWRAAFDGSYGIIAKGLTALGLGSPAWFSLQQQAGAASSILPKAMLPSLVAEVWQWTPFVALVTALSVRQAAPGLIQWSRATASGRLRAIWVAEFPLVSRLLFLLAFLRFLDSLKTFESVYVPFGNGLLTATISIRISTYALEVRDYGGAAALSAMMLIVVVGLTYVATRQLLNLRRGRRV